MNNLTKSFKKTFTIFLTLVFILGTLPLYAADGLNNAKLEYLKIEAQNLEKINQDVQENIIKPYKEYLQKYMVPTKSTSEFSFDVQGNLPQDEQTQYLLKLLRNSKLFVDGYSSLKDKEVYARLGLNVESKDLFTFEELLDNDKLVYRVGDIYDKYFLLDLKKGQNNTELEFLKDLPKRVINYEDLEKALDINEKDLEKIFTKYAKVYAKSIKNEQVKITPGEFKEQNVNIPGKVITVSFTQQEYSELVNNLADTLAQDHELARLIYKNFSNFIKLYKDAGYFPADEEVPDFDYPQVQAGLQSFAQNLKDSVQKLNLTEDAQMVLYVDAQGNILDRQFTIVDAEQGNTILRTSNYTDKNDKNVQRFIVKNTKAEKVNKTELLYNEKPLENGITQGSFVFLSQQLEKGIQKELATFNINFTTERNAEKENLKGNYSFLLKDASKTNSFAGNVDYTSDLDSSERITKYNLDFNVNIPALDINILVNNKAAMQYDRKMNLPNYKNNCVDVFALTPEELETLTTELEQGFQAFIFKTMEILQPPMSL